MSLEMLQKLIRPELLTLVPFCWVVGMYIRKGKLLDNRYIPTLLWTIGIVFSFLYMKFMFKTEFDLTQIIISAIVNGTFVSAISVFGNEQVKQIKIK